MALINCPECSKEVSDKAPACPNCGVVLTASSTQTPDVQTTFHHSTQNIQKTSVIAIASLVTALMCIPVVSIVLGHIARRDIKRDPNLTGAGIAMVGLIMGYLEIIALTFYSILFFYGLMIIDGVVPALNSSDKIEFQQQAKLKKRVTTAIIKTKDINFSVTVEGEISPAKDLKNLIILTHLNQADIFRVSKNQQVKVEIEAVADLIIDGIVERIAPQATIRSGIKGFSTRIKLLNAAPSIIPGMTATINIPVANSKGVVAAPLASIFTERNDSEQRTETYAYVKKEEGKPPYVKQMVDVGVNDLVFVEVLKGLSVGDEVALEKPDDDQITETNTLD
ncbi:DUF4190 domain-containing protein [bacterium]|nr:DUF4190 domain-containing protein [bacterium]